MRFANKKNHVYQLCKKIVILILFVLFAASTGCYSFNSVELNPFAQKSGNLKRFVLYSDGSSGACLGGPGTAAQILLIPIQGEITGSKGLSRSGVSPSMIRKILKRAERDGGYSAILLKIDSPGGSVTASDEIYHMLSTYARKNKIKVFAHIDSVGASGAYYIAMASQNINASPTAIVGSIGVIMRGFDLQGLMGKIGVKERIVASGKNKNMYSPFQDVTPEQRLIMERHVKSSYERFLSIILNSRRNKLKVQALRKYADGRIFSAVEAQQFRLTDSVQYLDDYIKQMKRKLGLHNMQIVSYLPAEGRYESLYDIRRPPMRDLASVLLSLLGPGRLGLLYLWEGGY